MFQFGIIFLKVLKRIKSFMKIFIWKLLYAKNFRCGKHTVFYPGVRLILDGKGCIMIGNHCFFNNGCSITSMERIVIGDNCIFGENVKLYDHNHRHDISSQPYREQGYRTKKITIGSNVWIGSNVVILAGVTIGDNVVIGAGAVVHESVPENTMIYTEQRCNEKLLSERQGNKCVSR